MLEKKLLVVHLGALGDFITTFPALHLFQRQYRSIDAICQKKLGKLACYLNIIDNHFPLESAVVSSLFSETAHPQLHRIIGAYHAIILFSFSEDLKDSIRRLTAQNVYRVAPRPKPEEKIHIAAHLLSSLTAAGLFQDSMDPDGSFLQFTARGQRDPGYDASHIILHPGSGSSRKNWPLSNYVQLADMLGKRGMRTTFICGPAERKMVSEIERSGHAVHAGDDLVVFSKLLEKAGGFIGNDSGISHLSAYLGVPTVAIFGPSDPHRWRPIGPSVSVVRADLDCRPCFETVQNRCQSPDCLNDLTPSRVMDAFSALTGRSPPLGFISQP